MEEQTNPNQEWSEKAIKEEQEKFWVEGEKVSMSQYWKKTVLKHHSVFQELREVQCS